ncbi:MAG: glycosyltransferase [Candidatus Omnitrophota bacterium]|jgi:glycosyltransferase involved in cell wall biosynthesis
MKISLVIPTLNREESLRKVFEDLRKQSHKDFEAVILDGGSSDGTANACRDYADYFTLSFHRQKRPGIVAAMNEALEYCHGDIFTRTDDDVSLPQGWLSEIVSAFSRYPAAGVTGPTIIPQERMSNRDLLLFNEKIRDSSNPFWIGFRKLYHGYFMEGDPFGVARFFRSGAFSLGSNYESSRNIKDIKEVDYLESCNWSMRLDLIRKVGGFDERYGGVSEYFEADCVFRVKRLGHKMYFNPGAYIYHLVDKGGNFKARSGTYSRMHNFILFYLRNIKSNTPDKTARFTLYLLFMNIYYVYCFLRDKNIRQLSGIIATPVSIVRYFREIFKQVTEI